MTVYEVFRQERKGQPFAHAGAIAAPDASFAEAYARKRYSRLPRESVALWVVPRRSIMQIEEFVDELQRNYHRVDGYPLKAALKEARERRERLLHRDQRRRTRLLGWRNSEWTGIAPFLEEDVAFSSIRM